MLATAAWAEEPAAPVVKAYDIEIDRVGPNDWLAPWEGASREVLFSARLAALFARDQRYGQESHSVGLLGFDPLMPLGNISKDRLKLRVVSRDGEKAVVEATIQDYGGRPAQKVMFETVFERNAWRIDEISERDDKGVLVSLTKTLQGPHECGSEIGKPCMWPPETAPSPANGAPTDVVKAIYKAAFKDIKNPDSTYEAYNDENLRERYFTTALRKAAEGIDAINLKYNEDVLDFDPITSSNGFPDPSNLAVRAVSSDAQSALVVASFGKGKERVSVAYHLVKAGDAWRIDDISGPPGAKGTDVWSLRTIYDEAVASLPKD
jgi:hypothetical protein